MHAKVPPAQDGKTVASALRAVLPGTSWTDVRGLIAAGRITLDGSPVGTDAIRVKAGGALEILPLGTARQAARGEAASLLVHVDRDLVVVRKPAGVLSVPASPDDRDTLRHRATLAVRRHDTAHGNDGSPTLRVVQRLDRETSGLLVFARTVAAERELQAQLKDRAMERRYLALVHGSPRARRHETFLLENRGDGLRGSWGAFRAARPADGEPPVDARRAVTTVEVLETLAGAALVGCVLETGRQHQIRIHLAEAGHPLLGETVYIRDYRQPLLAAPRLMLHAEALGFTHPRTGLALRFEEPPPPDFRALLERLRRP